MRRRLKSKTSKTAVEVTALEWFSEVVRLGLTMELAAAAPADHFKVRPGRRDFRGVKSAGSIHFFENSKHWVCQRLSGLVRIGNVHAVPTITVLGPRAPVDSQQLNDAGLKSSFIDIVGNTGEILCLEEAPDVPRDRKTIHPSSIEPVQLARPQLRCALPLGGHGGLGLRFPCFHLSVNRALASGSNPRMRHILREVWLPESKLILARWNTGQQKLS